MPAAGGGMFASTLSVEISNSGSSRATWSPSFLIQRTIVPSAIDSPICGMTTSVGMNLDVYRASVDPLSCLSDSFSHCRMGVNRSDQFFDGALSPQRHRGLGNQFGRPGTNHVYPPD